MNTLRNKISIMNNRYTPILLIMATLFITSCGSPKYLVDYDESINFYRYETYNFTPAADSIPLNQLIKSRLFNAISTEMNGADISWAEEPDIFVHVHMMMKGRTKTNVTYGQGETVSLGSGFSTTYMDLSEYSEGSVFFDIIDAKRKQLVWTGKITGDIGEADWTSKNIQQVVHKVFRKFPPRPPK
ncbi:MAG TPA: DUF4136 domain-containing protein [Bacteroides sp.]|nr:DUF4136 domain-containing protein [Bacteroides sp.]